VFELARQLDDYDVLLFTVTYRHGSAAFWNDLGAPLSAWIRSGGMVIVAGGREPGDLGWLRNIHPALVMALRNCFTTSDAADERHWTIDRMEAMSWQWNCSRTHCGTKSNPCCPSILHSPRADDRPWTTGCVCAA
jgi:hypothetical protein